MCWILSSGPVKGGGNVSSNSSNSFSLAEGPYAPMHINANLPAGSSLRWTLIDAQTGDNISGFESIEGMQIHLDAVDWEHYGSLRVQLQFEGLGAGSMPSVESPARTWAQKNRSAAAGGMVNE